MVVSKAKRSTIGVLILGGFFFISISVYLVYSSFTPVYPQLIGVLLGLGFGTVGVLSIWSIWSLNDLELNDETL